MFVLAMRESQSAEPATSLTRSKRSKASCYSFKKSRVESFLQTFIHVWVRMERDEEQEDLYDDDNDVFYQDKTVAFGFYSEMSFPLGGLVTT